MGNLGYVLLVLGLVNAVLCQEGLRDRFQPSVKASCVGGTMTIRVDTKEPFEGIVHGPNRTEAGCSAQGRGGLKTYLRIDLTKTEGQEGYCGVKYDTRTEERRVAIAVRAHPTIELLEDKLYVVTCGRAGFQNSRDEVSVVMMKVTLPGDHSVRASTVLEGEEYDLQVQVTDHDPTFGILVRRCFAFDDSDTSLQLVDDRGCVAEKLISAFSYDHEAGTADATIFSMFRLPHSNRTYFQCDVSVCKGECPQPTCDGHNSPIVLKDKTNANATDADPFARTQDEDTITTSTSVFVAQPGSEAAAHAVYCATGYYDAYYGDWLLWLCIAFGVLFGIMLLINIFLCSAMTCSCTRSEIIEKEPSIYDEYDYDSQYGYTNGKVYGSESDYGGSMYDHDGGLEPVAPGRAASEAGTYHSKYSHQPANSTLSRQRH